MNSPSTNQFFSKFKFSLAAIAVLGIGLVAAILGTQSSQDQRTRASVGIPVAYDRGSTSTVAPGSSVRWNHTTSNQTDRLLLVSVSVIDSTIDRVSSVTYSGQNLTQVPGGTRACSAGCRSEVWYLINPPVGTFSVSVYMSGTSSPGIVVNGATFYNVDQVNPFGNVMTNSGYGTSSSVNVTAGTGGVVFDVANASNGGTIQPRSGQVKIGTSSSYTGGSGTQSLGWSLLNGSTYWANVGVAINQVAQTPTALPPPPSATQVPPTPTYTPVPPTPTALPTQTPTPAPTAVPTCTPRPACLDAQPRCLLPEPAGGFCPTTATVIPTPTATVAPTPTQVPTATPLPTIPPEPTATPVPGATMVRVNLLMHGIGRGGDSVSANSQGNYYLQRPQRTVSMDVYDVENRLVISKLGTVLFDPSFGGFSGAIDLGTAFPTGIYTIKVKTDQYLRGLVSGIQTLTRGQTTEVPTVTLVAGDINNDNQVNIVDYNIFIGCYSDLLPPISCNDSNQILADLNDDGHVNQFDYNLFIRELTNIGGQ